MPLAPIIGAALQVITAPPWSIFIDGNDLAFAPGTAGHRVGIPIDSVELDLEGGGGVSSASFDVTDPDRAVTVSEGSRVVFYDHVRGVPRFAGWVQSWANTPLGISRRIHLEAQGFEAILDWAFIPGTLTIPSGTTTPNAILAVAGAATYPPGVALLAFGPPAGGTNGDARAGAGVGSFLPFSYVLQQDAVITDTSLRDALKAVAAVSGDTGGLSGELVVPRLNFTVDFWGYLRAWIGTPDDWAGVVTSSGFGSSSPAPAAPSFLNDAAGASHAVYVVGGNAAGTGMVVDGTGIPGPIARINDSTITTANGKTAAAFAYMQERSGIQRAPVQLQDYIPAGSPGNAHPRPGAGVSIRDAQLGIDPSASYRMDGITIAFTAGGDAEQWEISAGGRRPSAVNYIRRLTRGVKSG